MYAYLYVHSLVYPHIEVEEENLLISFSFLFLLGGVDSCVLLSFRLVLFYYFCIHPHTHTQTRFSLTKSTRVEFFSVRKLHKSMQIAKLKRKRRRNNKKIYINTVVGPQIRIFNEIMKTSFNFNKIMNETKKN